MGDSGESRPLFILADRAALKEHHVSRPLRFDHAGRCGDDLRPAPEGAVAGSGNCYASASVRKSVALVPISLGLTGSSPAVAAGLVAAAATFRESATGAIIIFQGSMRTLAQNTKACIGQNAGCMYSSSFHSNARQAKVFPVRQITVPDFGFYADTTSKRSTHRFYTKIAERRPSIALAPHLPSNAAGCGCMRAAPIRICVA